MFTDHQAGFFLIQMSLTEPAFCNHFFHIFQNLSDISSCRRSNFLNITKFPVSQNRYILAKPSHRTYHIYSYISHHCKRYKSNCKNSNNQTTDYIKRCDHLSLPEKFRRSLPKFLWDILDSPVPDNSDYNFSFPTSSVPDSDDTSGFLHLICFRYSFYLHIMAVRSSDLCTSHRF